MASQLHPITSSVLATKAYALLPNSQQLIVVTPEQDMLSALNTLVKHDIYSAPVVDLYHGTQYGFLDMVDVVTYLVDLLTKESGELGDDFYAIVAKAEKFQQTGPIQVADLSRRNPMHPMKRNSTVFDVFEVIVKTGAHRIPLVQEANVTNVLTLSAIVDWLNKNLEGLGYISFRTVRELGLGYKDVICINKKDRALDAFKLMVEKKVSAVGIVEDDGTLVGNISAKDIKVRLFQHREFTLQSLLPGLVLTKLYRPCGEFALAAKKKDPTPIMHLSAISCREDTTFADVVKALAESKIHRIYLVDKSNKPVGVISLIDILDAILKDLETRMSKFG